MCNEEIKGVLCTLAQILQNCHYRLALHNSKDLLHNTSDAQYLGLHEMEGLNMI